MRDSAISARSEASAPFVSGSKLSGWKRALRLISALSPRQRQITSGFSPISE